MDLNTLSSLLDEEFGIGSNQENLVEWAVTDKNRRYVSEDFLARETGLMVKNSSVIEKVFTAVFITERVMDQVSKSSNSLIITHHNFNYFEDRRGLQAIPNEFFEQLRDRRNSLYVAHAPLDTHSRYGTSKCLAELCGITIDEYFFDYFGAPVALYGHREKIAFEEYAELVRMNLKRPSLTLIKNRDYVRKIAVVAGGGDLPEILEQAHGYGCDTYLGGTIEHRWDAPFVQEGNRRFHELNADLKLNLIGGTHYATERPAMLQLTELIEKYGIACEYIEDEELLNAP